MIDAGIEAELVHHVIALCLAACDTDDAAARDLRELAGHTAHRARRGRHDHRLAGLRLPDLFQAEPRGDAGHPEDAEVIRRRRALCIDRHEIVAARDPVALPAEWREHPVARLESRIARLEHFADGLARHRLVELRGRHIRFRVAHPASHGLGGRNLNSEWEKEAVSYKGLAVAGYPNYFKVNGPNTGSGHSSQISYMEATTDYIVQAICAVKRDESVKAIDARRDLQDAYVADMHESISGEHDATK